MLIRGKFHDSIGRWQQRWMISAMLVSMEKREVANARAKAWYAVNRERAKARITAWTAANPEKRAVYVQADNAKRADSKRAWRLEHPESDQRYYEDNRAKYIENARKRQRRMRADQRCNCCDAESFAKIYVAARFIDAEVDHVKPLALGGLHCCKNLQVLTKVEHRKKTIDDNRAIALHRRDHSPQQAATMMDQKEV
jgi:5-methylcytosine-specific restriction endonuclease McrA